MKNSNNWNDLENDKTLIKKQCLVQLVGFFRRGFALFVNCCRLINNFAHNT